MTVVECDNRKIRKVRVRRAEPEAPEEDAL